MVDVVATRMLMAHGFLKSIFEVFANHRCPVDMVSTSEVSVSVTVDSNESIAAIAADLARLADVKYRRPQSHRLPGGGEHQEHAGHRRQGLQRHP